jgi:hypothetical protein
MDLESTLVAVSLTFIIGSIYTGLIAFYWKLGRFAT